MRILFTLKESTAWIVYTWEQDKWAFWVCPALDVTHRLFKRMAKHRE